MTLYFSCPAWYDSFLMGSAPHKQRQMQRAREWMLKHPGASIADTMKATGISQSSVSDLRRNLKEAGLLGTYPHTPSPTVAVETSEAASAAPHVIQSPPPLGSEEEVEAVITGTAQLTREQRRRKLDDLMKYGAPDHIIRANNAIEVMERQERAPDEIGPPPPQTLADGVRQIADMIEALAAWGGEGAVKEAVTMGLKHYYAQEPKFDVQPHVAPTAEQPSGEFSVPGSEGEASN